MSKLKLKSVRVRNPVPFDGPATLTLSFGKGTLEYDTVTGIVSALPKTTGSLAKSLCIPLGNIDFFEVLDEEAEKVQLKAKLDAIACLWHAGGSCARSS